MTTARSQRQSEMGTGQKPALPDSGLPVGAAVFHSSPGVLFSSVQLERAGAFWAALCTEPGELACLFLSDPLPSPPSTPPCWVPPQLRSSQLALALCVQLTTFHLLHLPVSAFPISISISRFCAVPSALSVVSSAVCQRGWLRDAHAGQGGSRQNRSHFPCQVPALPSPHPRGSQV